MFFITTVKGGIFQEDNKSIKQFRQKNYNFLSIVTPDSVLLHLASNLPLISKSIERACLNTSKKGGTELATPISGCFKSFVPAFVTLNAETKSFVVLFQPFI